jgi:hypothetical protein
MRLICFILSVVVFFISLYFFILKVPEIVTFNDTIYILLLVVSNGNMCTGRVDQYKGF